MSQQPNINKFIELGFILSDGRQDDVKIVSNGCPSDQPKAEKKRIDKNREEKNRLVTLFDSFWNHYPKKKNKGQAEKAWKKIKPKPNAHFLLQLKSNIEQAINSEDWLKDGGKYIPYPATWLNAKGWEDEFYVSPIKGVVSEKTTRSMQNIKSWMKEGNGK